MSTPASPPWGYSGPIVTTLGIHSPGDIARALSASVEKGGLVLDEKDLSADFFDLGTGFAGTVLQKFVTYRTRLAVIVRDPSSYGSRFSEMAHEHRTHPAVRFFGSEQQARQWLANMPSGKY
jgi:hypothetical protein